MHLRGNKTVHHLFFVAFIFINVCCASEKDEKENFENFRFPLSFNNDSKLELDVNKYDLNERFFTYVKLYAERLKNINQSYDDEKIYLLTKSQLFSGLEENDIEGTLSEKLQDLSTKVVSRVDMHKFFMYHYLHD